jgi:hypothetical protein
MLFVRNNWGYAYRGDKKSFNSFYRLISEVRILNVYEKYRKNELGDVDRTDFLKLSQFGSACKCE